jgi:hypothetical protein
MADLLKTGPEVLDGFQKPWSGAGVDPVVASSRDLFEKVNSLKEPLNALQNKGDRDDPT